MMKKSLVPVWLTSDPKVQDNLEAVCKLCNITTLWGTQLAVSTFVLINNVQETDIDDNYSALAQAKYIGRYSVFS